MPLAAGSGAVVTGGGGGIGGAIARRLAAEGLRVVVADVDADAASVVAAEVGGLAVAGDTASEAGVEALLGQARSYLGEVDVYVANAGVGTGGGPDAPEDAWTHAWEVNLMAHVRASRALLPRWLERGHGRFVSTASAAGVLMMLGSAPYTVTKHAALSYAEWLSATYRHRGVVVQCICPQGVRTAMLDGTGPAGAVTLVDGAIEPEAVADALWDAIVDDRFLVLPHPEVAAYERAKAADRDRWLTGMNRLQQRIQP